MKKCSTCQGIFKFSFFEKRKDSRDGYRGQCKNCRSKTYKKNADSRNKQRKKWGEKNPDKLAEYRKRYKLKNGRRVRNQHLVSTYGITIDQYESMLNDQNGKCWICKNSFKTLCVDHCHSTGRIRGLLCKNCNFGIGKFKDNIKNLENAIKYLTKEYYDAGSDYKKIRPY